MVGGGEAVCSGTVMRDSLSEAAVSNGEAADSNGIVIAGTETGYRGGWKRIDWLIPGVVNQRGVVNRHPGFHHPVHHPSFQRPDHRQSVRHHHVLYLRDMLSYYSW